MANGTQIFKCFWPVLLVESVTSIILVELTSKLMFQIFAMFKELIWSHRSVFINISHSLKTQDGNLSCGGTPLEARFPSGTRRVFLGASDCFRF